MIFLYFILYHIISHHVISYYIINIISYYIVLYHYYRYYSVLNKFEYAHICTPIILSSFLSPLPSQAASHRGPRPIAWWWWPRAAATRCWRVPAKWTVAGLGGAPPKGGGFHRGKMWKNGFLHGFPLAEDLESGWNAKNWNRPIPWWYFPMLRAPVWSISSSSSRAELVSHTVSSWLKMVLEGDDWSRVGLRKYDWTIYGNSSYRFGDGSEFQTLQQIDFGWFWKIGSFGVENSAAKTSLGSLL